MAFEKVANAEIVDLISLGAWEKMHLHRAFGAKTAAVKQIAADQSKVLLSHCTIMSSVMVEEDPYDFLIKPEASHLVNNNDDAWENTVMRLSYKSFVGAFNFLEHKQKAKLAKGHILDAVLRKVKLAPDVWVYYVDILVATDLAHESLVADIRENKVKYMSMGCTTELVVCSYCGARCTDESTFCQHLLSMKGQFLMDDDGIPRRIAELCGHKSLPNGGVKFVEASWVGTPAFPGAALRTFIDGGDGLSLPKTPFTHAASANKIASLVPGAPNTGDAKLDAYIRRIF